MDVTIVIPIGNGHEAVAERAIASARSQTVPCKIVTVYDKNLRGAGWARNQGIKQVDTRWMVFLDADDILEPLFVERTLSVARANRYVYTGWYEDSRIKSPPERAWCGGTWHVITTLLPSDLVRSVGGFDESLPGAEDTDFYIKIVTRRYCGIRLDEPLVHYINTPDARSKQFRAGSLHDATMDEITRRYSGLMGCCGNMEIEDVPVGEKQPGDILAMALWGGNRRETGRATGRHYPRTGNLKTAWVDPRDVDAAPHLWVQVLEPSVDDVPVLHGVAAIAGAFMDNVYNEPIAVSNGYQGPIRYEPPSELNKKEPNIEKVVRLYRNSKTGN